MSFDHHQGARRADRRDPSNVSDPDLAGLQSDEGWLFASSLPVGAGDPGRFHALFGRDSLISSLALLPVRPGIARATLRALARRRGRRVDPVTLEEPGKIGHEFRPETPTTMIDAGWPERGEFNYYATADATSWFLVVLASLGERALRDELEPAWRGAGAWLAHELDRSGGLVRHAPTTVPGGLVQQGWRDSHDPLDPYGGGILHPSARTPAGRLADADTQAVTYAALRALDRLDPAAGWSERAAALKARVSAAFIGPVMALEPDDTVVVGAGSQLGWLLWAGALESAPAALAAARLCRPDVLTEFGLRTLSSDSPVFAPHAYHRGSIWPFDSWLGWGGLRACGREAEAEQVRAGVLAALERLGDAPELYAVTRAGELEPIALSNRRQAWTVAARWALANRWDGRAYAA
jgi:glycogen debranching enzyme